MKSVFLLIVIVVITCRFGWAVISGLKAGRFYSSYGESLEPDFREEPIGFTVIAILYVALLGGLIYLSVDSVIDVYEQFLS